MCLSCGCGQPNDAHDNPDHITLERLRRAGEAADISPQEAARNIARAVLGTDEGAWTPGSGIERGDRAGPPGAEGDDEPVVTEAHGSVM
jgi:hypothetical protein